MNPLKSFKQHYLEAREKYSQASDLIDTEHHTRAAVGSLAVGTLAAGNTYVIPTMAHQEIAIPVIVGSVVLAIVEGGRALYEYRREENN